MSTVKIILILSANPQSTSKRRFDEEIREIEDGLKLSKNRDQFEIRSKLAIRLRDLRRELLDNEPYIVHFTGKGEDKGLILEGNEENGVLASTSALSGLFELFSDKIECVVLNACYSAPQANAISEHINYVIGMESEIEHKASIEFAVGFFDAIGAGWAVEKAYKLGCNGIEHASPDLPKQFYPILKKKGQSEDHKYQLPFVGRREKLNECFKFLDKPGDRYPSRLLLISGNSGTGKTFFCKELLHTHLTFNPGIFCLYIDFNSDEFAGTLFLQSLIYLSWNTEKFSRKNPTNIPRHLTFRQYLKRKKFKKSVIEGFQSILSKSVHLLPIFAKSLQGLEHDMESESCESEQIPDLSYAFFNYLRSISIKSRVILAFDNYQFVSESFRLMFESLLNSVDENICLLLINRTKNDVSYIDEINCFQHYRHFMQLTPFTFTETLSLMEKVFSEVPRDVIKKISDDSFHKTHGNLKELEYYIIHYKKNTEKKSPIFNTDTFINTIGSLPVLQKHILTIAALFPLGLRKDYVIKIIEKFLSGSGRISIQLVIEDLEKLGYLIINSANGELVRPAHEKIETVMKEIINEEEFIELQGMIVNTFEELIFRRTRIKEYLYLLHCLVGILSNAQILSKLDYVINLIDLQYQNSNYQYITFLYKATPKVIENLPDHIVLAVLDSFQKTSEFYLGMKALKQIESMFPRIKDEISLYYAKYLTQTYRFEQALAILDEMPETAEVVQYKINILQHLCREGEAIRLIKRSLSFKEKPTAYFIILRNSAHLYPYDTALQNLFTVYDYFDRQEFIFGKATALNNIGVVYLWNYELEKSETILMEAKNLMEGVNSNEIFEPIWNIGVQKALQNKYKKAKELLMESKGWVSQSLRLDHIIIEMNVLMVEACKTKTRSSILKLLEDLEYLYIESKKMNDPRVHTQICFNLSALYRLLNIDAKYEMDQHVLEILLSRETTGIEVFKKVRIGKKAIEILFILSPHWRY